MPLICYVHSRGGGVPYLEVLPEGPVEACVRLAAQLLAERPGAESAELWDGETLVHTLERAAAG